MSLQDAQEKLIEKVEQSGIGESWLWTPERRQIDDLTREIQVALCTFTTGCLHCPPPCGGFYPLYL